MLIGANLHVQFLVSGMQYIWQKMVRYLYEMIPITQKRLSYVVEFTQNHSNILYKTNIIRVIISDNSP